MRPEEALREIPEGRHPCIQTRRMSKVLMSAYQALSLVCCREESPGHTGRDRALVALEAEGLEEEQRLISP